MDRHAASRDAARRRLGQARQQTNSNTVIVVAGPPCSGKTTYVRTHAARGDVTIDFDAIAVSLGSVEQWNHSPLLQSVAHAAQDASIARFQATDTNVTMWVIVTDPAQAQQYGLANARLITMDTEPDECERRAVALGRTQAVINVIRSYGNH